MSPSCFQQPALYGERRVRRNVFTTLPQWRAAEERATPTSDRPIENLALQRQGWLKRWPWMKLVDWSGPGDAGACQRKVLEQRSRGLLLLVDSV